MYFIVCFLFVFTCSSQIPFLVMQLSVWKQGVYRRSPGHPDTVLIHSEDRSDVTHVNTNESHYPGNANIILTDLLTTPLFIEVQNCTHTLWPSFTFQWEGAFLPLCSLLPQFLLNKTRAHGSLLLLIDTTNNDRSNTGNWLFKDMTPKAVLSDTSEVTFCLSAEEETTGFGMLNMLGQNTLLEPCAFLPAPPSIQKLQEDTTDNFSSRITSKFCVLRLLH